MNFFSLHTSKTAGQTTENLVIPAKSCVLNAKLQDGDFSFVFTTDKSRLNNAIILDAYRSGWTQKYSAEIVNRHINNLIAAASRNVYALLSESAMRLVTIDSADELVLERSVPGITPANLVNVHRSFSTADAEMIAGCLSASETTATFRETDSTNKTGEIFFAPLTSVEGRTLPPLFLKTETPINTASWRSSGYSPRPNWFELILDFLQIPYTYLGTSYTSTPTDELDVVEVTLNFTGTNPSQVTSKKYYRVPSLRGLYSCVASYSAKDQTAATKLSIYATMSTTQGSRGFSIPSMNKFVKTVFNRSSKHYGNVIFTNGNSRPTGDTVPNMLGRFFDSMKLKYSATLEALDPSLAAAWPTLRTAFIARNCMYPLILPIRLSTFVVGQSQSAKYFCVEFASTALPALTTRADTARQLEGPASKVLTISDGQMIALPLRNKLSQLKPTDKTKAETELAELEKDTTYVVGCAYGTAPIIPDQFIESTIEYQRLAEKGTPEDKEKFLSTKIGSCTLREVGAKLRAKRFKGTFVTLLDSTKLPSADGESQAEVMETDSLASLTTCTASLFLDHESTSVKAMLLMNGTDVKIYEFDDFVATWGASKFQHDSITYITSSAAISSWIATNYENHTLNELLDQAQITGAAAGRTRLYQNPAAFKRWSTIDHSFGSTYALGGLYLDPMHYDGNERIWALTEAGAQGKETMDALWLYDAISVHGLTKAS